MKTRLFSVLMGCLLVVGPSPVWAARDAAFMAPSAAAASSQQDQAVTIEPKSEVDVGETPINVGRRATFFFVNQSGATVEIVSITANGDSNVRAEIVGDDCSKQKKIEPTSRCAVTVETTPTGSGSWTAEVLMTHASAGRIARARVTGKTNSGGSSDKKESGLSLSTKDIKPVDFGDVELGGGKAVRTALMINDSNEPLTILSVEVIAPENGLQKLEQGCASDMDLKIGESCPVTLIWSPDARGAISTDLIIRHSGRLGFAVIPIRGMAKEALNKNGDSTFAKGKNDGKLSDMAPSGKPGMSPTASEMERMIADKMPPISGEALSPPSGRESGHGANVENGSSESFRLIGTVGNRAVLFKPDGTTTIVAAGDEILLDNGKTVKVINVLSRQAEILIGDKKKVLRLESAPLLTNKAAQSRADNNLSSPKKALKENGAPQQEPSIVKLPTAN